LPTTLLTRMTGISMHVQWYPTSQTHGSFLKENNWFFCYGSNSPLNYYFLEWTGTWHSVASRY
jgi:hypothetical protein